MLIYDFHVSGIKLISENFLYKPGFNRGHSYLYKNPVIKGYQELLIRNFSENSNFDKTTLPNIKDTSGMVTFYTFGVTENRYFERDLTNMLKATEDALFGIKDSLFPSAYDDSLVVMEGLRKVVSEDEFIDVRVGIMLHGDEMNSCFMQLILGSN